MTLDSPPRSPFDASPLMAMTKQPDNVADGSIREGAVSQGGATSDGAKFSHTISDDVAERGVPNGGGTSLLRRPTSFTSANSLGGIDDNNEDDDDDNEDDDDDDEAEDDIPFACGNLSTTALKSEGLEPEIETDS